MSHAPLSPSASHRWLNCPGSRLVRKDESDTNPAAELGTRIHGVAADRLSAALTETETPENCELADEDSALADRFVEYVLDHRTPDSRVFVERYVDHDIPDFGGTPDVVISNSRELHVFDLKTGQIPVAAKDNTQLGCYLLLASHADAIPNNRRYFGHIYHRFGGPETAEFTVDDLVILSRRIEHAVANEYREAGPWCEWCPALATCEAARTYYQKIFHELFAE